MTTLAPKAQTSKVLELFREPTVVTKEEEGTYAKQCLLTGPYAARRPSHTERLSIGLIGTYNLIDLAKEWLQSANSFIESVPSRELESPFDQKRQKLLFPDFPGFPIAFAKTLVVEPEFEAKLTLNEVAELNGLSPQQYASRLEGLIEARFATMLRLAERRPDVVIILLTDDMYDTCHVTGDYHQKLKPAPEPLPEQFDLFSDFDKLSIDIDPKSIEPLSHNFRSRLKKIAMAPKYSVPIQIIREQTLRGKGTQNLATRSWNLLTGLYYKAGDIPWILGGLDAKTCFLGVSFFHKKSAERDLVLSSMSHLFANDFNSVILRGEQVAYDYALKSPVLTADSAVRIAERALQEFWSARRAYPERIVVHKTSMFNDDEIGGFQAAFNNVNLAFDLVSITKSPLKIIRWGQYPVPRGTALISEDSHAHLYTKGFVPDLQTCPGSHVPSPFEIRKARGDSSIKTICSDVLALTKLNWNTADFCCGVPITVSFARNVGDVFKEFDESSEYEPSRYFRFYM
jgi:hypothetical protein